MNAVCVVAACVVELAVGDAVLFRLYVARDGSFLQVLDALVSLSESARNFLRVVVVKHDWRRRNGHAGH
eukprot:2376641-Pleurochrysis_carterae.AAC.1